MNDTKVKVTGTTVQLSWWEGKTKVFTEFEFSTAPTTQNVTDAIAFARGA